MTTPSEYDDRPLVGISACLLGQRVRYDGQGRFNSVVDTHIAPYCRLLAICPEAVAGLGIPRPPINLVETPAGIRALGRDEPHRDVTDRITTVGDIIATTYPALCGYIFQSRSPSCGFSTTPVYDCQQLQIRTDNGSGLFAQRIHDRYPALPLCNDTDLDRVSAEEFLARVRACQQRQA